MTKSTKHWYPRYCGDYSQKTRHLSMLEHGAYTLLLDYCYSTEKPIPANAEQLHRVCMAFAEAEQAAVQSVIDQFFELTPNGYINKRVEEELEKRRNISVLRSEAAKSKHNRHANAPAIVPANADTSTSTPTSTNKRDSIYIPDDVSNQVWEDFKILRKNKKSPITETAINQIRKQAESINWSLDRALQECCARGWQGFKAEWITKGNENGKNNKSVSERADDAMRQALAQYGIED